MEKNNHKYHHYDARKGHYDEEKKVLFELINHSDAAQERLFRHILLVSASILGIVVSLHSIETDSPCIRLVYACSILLLTLGVLAAGVVVYAHANSYDQQRREYQKELIHAINKNGKMEDVYTEKKKYVVVLEKVALFCLLIGLTLLATYAILTLFIGEL